MLTELGLKSLRVPEGIDRLLRDLIHSRTGLFFEENRMDTLLAKLEPLARNRGCESFLEYYYALKDNEPNVWEQTWEALSVQETYFWREMAQLDALTGEILPAWFQHRSLPFRVWSAACATGEEPYSIAISLVEAGFGAHPIEIIASDANSAALAKAESAIYRERSFRSLPPALREKYFERVAGGWRLSSEIAGRVKLKRANLCDPGEAASLARAQVIFCRNVFIYFSPHAVRQAVAALASKMPSGGCLFVGAAESLLRVTTDFELKELGNALAYVRL